MERASSVAPNKAKQMPRSCSSLHRSSRSTLPIARTCLLRAASVYKLNIAAIRLQVANATAKLPGRLEDVEVRKTRMAAPVSFSRWFGRHPRQPVASFPDCARQPLSEEVFERS